MNSRHPATTRNPCDYICFGIMNMNQIKSALQQPNKLHKKRLYFPLCVKANTNCSYKICVGNKCGSTANSQSVISYMQRM